MVRKMKSKSNAVERLVNKVIFRNAPRMGQSNAGGVLSRYVPCIISVEEEWRAITKASPRPIGDRIEYYGHIYVRLNAEREEAIREWHKTGLSETNFDWSECPGANDLWFQVRAMYHILSYCREIPNRSVGDLVAYLSTLPVMVRRDYAIGVDDMTFFRSVWPALYGSKKAADSSELARWTPADWDDFHRWKHEDEQNRSKALEEEGRARLQERGELEADRLRIKVVSTDTDVIRVLEAMLDTGIIDQKTRQHQLVDAFQWKGALNGKPKNYAAAKKQLTSPPSDKIIAMIGHLLAGAADDIWDEVIALRPKRRR